MKVLLIEQDLDLTEILIEFLKEWGCEVDQARSKESALFFLKQKYHLIIIDHFTYAKFELNTINLAHQNILIMTSLPKQVKKHFNKLKDFKLIKKPFNIQDLENIFNNN